MTTVATSWVGSFLGVIIVISSTFSVLFASISHEFGWDRASLSLAYSLFSLTSTLAMPLIGVAVDKLGARVVITVCASAFAVLMGLLQFASHLWVFCLIFALTGLIAGGTSSLTYFKALVSIFSAHRGLALGLANSGTAAGTLAFPLIANKLNDLLGWRDTYLVLGSAVVLVTIPVVWWGLSGQASAATPRPAADATTSPGEATVLSAVTTPAFWLTGTAFFLATSALVGYLIHAVPLLKDRGLSTSTAVLAASTFGAAQLIGRLLTGWLLDRLSSTGIVATLWLLAASSFVALWTGLTGPTLLGVAAILGLAFGGEGDVLAYMVSRLFGPGPFGRIYSLLLMINLLGGVAGPYIFGAVFDSSGNYNAILNGSAVAMVVAAALIVCVRPGAYAQTSLASTH